MEFPHLIKKHRERKRTQKIYELSPVVVKKIMHHSDNDCLTDLTVSIDKKELPRKTEPRQFSSDLASFAMFSIRENSGDYLADRLSFDIDATVKASTEVIPSGVNDQDWRSQTSPDGIKLVFKLVDPNPRPDTPMPIVAV